jgi:NAD(P)-dependent dehydrogenase (short-subunit alcohol dehydrogenase family)
MRFYPAGEPMSAEAVQGAALFSLAGKVAVVTGASRGIGGALATALAEAGATVVLLGRDAEALCAREAALRQKKCKAIHVVADIAMPAGIEAAFDRILQKESRLDILINNAGIEEPRQSLEVSEDLWDRIMATNLKGAFFCAQAAARRMAGSGSIINLCSLTAERGVAGAAPYSASKAGLAGLTRALAAEWAEKGIRVNGIAPGYFHTDLTDSFFQNQDWRRSMLEKIPLRRFGRLEDLKGAAIFLCSDAAAYITGQVLYVDGGCVTSL